MTVGCHRGIRELGHLDYLGPARLSSSTPWQSATNNDGSRHAVTTRRMPELSAGDGP
jgi:hypothetical protein